MYHTLYTIIYDTLMRKILAVYNSSCFTFLLNSDVTRVFSFLAIPWQQ